MYQFYNILLKTDITIRPLDKGMPSNTLEHTSVYLVSYADGHEVFHRNQYALALSALGRGVDMIMNYNKKTLRSSFSSKKQVYLQS